MTVKPQSAEMSMRTLGAITIVEFLDRRLIDTARIEALGSQIIERVNATPNISLILSFDKVEYLSSTMLNVVIAIDNAVRQKRGKLVLANLDPELQKVFSLMKLHKVMTICKSTDDAMSQFAKT